MQEIAQQRKQRISIHALLAESDQWEGMKSLSEVEFLSTLSLRRATVNTLKLACPMLFLSTLSLRRATTSEPVSRQNQRHFYPRSPCGERHRRRRDRAQRKHFYPRSPCGERRWQYCR